MSTPAILDSTEQQAVELSKDKKALRQRLMQARYVLRDDHRKLFRKRRFQFSKKRMVSDDGKLALQWRVRHSPNEPISYHNQQTSRGTVVCINIEKENADGT